MLRTIYWPQGAIMWVVSLPVQVAIYEKAALGVVSWIGVAVLTVGAVSRPPKRRAADAQP